MELPAIGITVAKSLILLVPNSSLPVETKGYGSDEVIPTIFMPCFSHN